MLKLLKKFVRRYDCLKTSSVEPNTPSVSTNSSVSRSSVINTPGNNNNRLSSSKKVIHPETSNDPVVPTVKALLEEIR